MFRLVHYITALSDICCRGFVLFEHFSYLSKCGTRETFLECTSGGIYKRDHAAISSLVQYTM